ncbi:PASTA domain-containing protein [Kocuria sp. CPCC 205268]|uniref:PASTA domain-containing protein n=1 Tax=Kocuria oxytropis TaxID=3058913 RepID=UPI0034D684E7
MSIDEVVQEIAAMGYAVQQEGQPSDEPPGVVLSVTPVGSVPRGSTVTVVYSTGPSGIEIPSDLIGRPADGAIADLIQSGLNVNRYEESTADADPGTVLRTDPVGGSIVDPGDTVDVWIAVEATDSPSPTDGN